MEISMQCYKADGTDNGSIVITPDENNTGRVAFTICDAKQTVYLNRESFIQALNFLPGETFNLL